MAQCKNLCLALENPEVSRKFWQFPRNAVVSPVSQMHAISLIHDRSLK